MDLQEFEQRKKDHIQHALDQKNQSNEVRALDRVHLFHDALPELDFEQVTLSEVSASPFCKEASTLKTPFFISGMTAGHEQALEINHRLAKACQHRGWAFGLGSQRRDLESDQAMDRWREFRKTFPELVVIGNIGLSQIIETSVEKIQSLTDQVQAQALAVHLNAHQEVIQREGTPRFRGGIAAIEKLTKALSVPVILKETGCGFSETTLKKIAHFSVSAIDVSGTGGTHWGRIEGARAEALSPQAIAAQTFGSWGETTVDSVISASKVFSESSSRPEIWASGGVRSGLDAAKLISLGADRVGYAMPALRAAMEGERELERWMEQQEFELRVALFGCGCETPKVLRESVGTHRLGQL